MPALAAAAAPARSKKPQKKSSPLDGIVARLFSTQEWMESVARRLDTALPGPATLEAARRALAGISEHAKALSHNLHELKKAGWAPPAAAAFAVGDKVALKPSRVQPFLKLGAYNPGDLINLTVAAVFGDRVKTKLPSGEVFGLYPSFYFKRAPRPAATATATTK